MASRLKDFKPEDVIKTLLWCARHCCFCGKACSTGIEVAHIDQDGPGVLDNAVPLCFECHQQIGNYNPKHPRGRSYRPAELRRRRDQIYEQYTSHLVPPLLYRLTQAGRQLPDVGFEISHVGTLYPVKVQIAISLAQGETNYGLISSPHYNGTAFWNLNPRFGVNGHFEIPNDVVGKLARNALRARIDITIFDIYERPHGRLPVGYVLPRADADWYLEPSEGVLNIPSTR